MRRRTRFAAERHRAVGLAAGRDSRQIAPPRTNVGPFFCGADRTIYLDLGFFDALARQAGLGGFAWAYVVGHEFGHHVQHVLGIDRRVAAANQANPGGRNALSVRVELQADCLAGAWAHSVATLGLPAQRPDSGRALRRAEGCAHDRRRLSGPSRRKCG
ncbi:MAG: neutral zinc metallopeptidase [Solirubrobacteraceae bacterium]